MNPALLHIRASPDVAMRYFGEWVGGPVPAVSTQSEANSWTTLRLGRYSLDFLGTEEWLRLGKHVDLCFETFSTSVCRGEIVLISSGEVRRHLVIGEDDPDFQVNLGKLRYEEMNSLKHWDDIWTFVEEWHWEAEVV